MRDDVRESSAYYARGFTLAVVKKQRRACRMERFRQEMRETQNEMSHAGNPGGTGMKRLWHRWFGHPERPDQYRGYTSPDGKSWGCTCGRIVVERKA